MPVGRACRCEKGCGSIARLVAAFSTRGRPFAITASRACSSALKRLRFPKIPPRLWIALRGPGPGISIIFLREGQRVPVQ